MEVLNQIAEFVNHNLMGVSAMSAVVLEAILRLVPTQKPKSILLAIAAGAHAVSSIVSGISSFLDKLVQNLK